MIFKKSVFFKRGLRALSLLISLLFAFDTIARPAPPPREVSVQPLVERISIPAFLGHLSEKFSPPPSLDRIDFPTVIHIQDAHASYEAQLQIKELLRLLGEKFGFNLILLEGGAGKLKPGLLRFLRNEKLNYKVVDELARQSEVGGAELFLLDRPSRARAFGLEEEDLYWKNLLAFRRVIQEKETSDHFLIQMKSKLDWARSHVLNPRLLSFLKDWMFYQDSESALLPHLEVLKRRAKRDLHLDLQNVFHQIEWPELVRLVKLQEIEKAIDLSKSNQERRKLLRWLRARRVGDEFVRRVRDFHQERKPREFLERFYEKTKPLGFQFRVYPSLTLVWARETLQSEIEAEALGREIETLEDLIFGKLARSESEKALVGLFKDYLLLRKLFSLELTREEYAKVKERELYLPVGARLPRPVNGRGNPAPTDVDVVFRLALSFYEGALKRDKAMIENTVRTMQETKQTKAVMITGGFHTEGITRSFKEKGIAYAVLSPRIPEMEDSSNYLKALMTPLDHSRPTKSQIKSWLYVSGINRSEIRGISGLQQQVEGHRRSQIRHAIESSALRSEVRMGTEEALRVIPQRLREKLKDPSPEVIGAAVASLIEVGELPPQELDQVVKKLIDLSKNSGLDSIRASAVLALGSILIALRRMSPQSSRAEVREGDVARNSEEAKSRLRRAVEAFEEQEREMIRTRNSSQRVRFRGYDISRAFMGPNGSVAVESVNENSLFGTSGCWECQGVVGVNLTGARPVSGISHHQFLIGGEANARFSLTPAFTEYASKYLDGKKEELLKIVRTLPGARQVVLVASYRSDTEAVVKGASSLLRQRGDGDPVIRALFIKRDEETEAVATVIATVDGVAIRTRTRKDRKEEPRELLLTWPRILSLLGKENIHFETMESLLKNENARADITTDDALNPRSETRSAKSPESKEISMEVADHDYPSKKILGSAQKQWEWGLITFGLSHDPVRKDDLRIVTSEEIRLSGSDFSFQTDSGLLGRVTLGLLSNSMTGERRGVVVSQGFQAVFNPYGKMLFNMGLRLSRKVKRQGEGILFAEIEALLEKYGEKDETGKSPMEQDLESFESDETLGITADRQKLGHADDYKKLRSIFRQFVDRREIAGRLGVVPEKDVLRYENNEFRIRIRPRGHPKNYAVFTPDTIKLIEPQGRIEFLAALGYGWRPLTAKEVERYRALFDFIAARDRLFRDVWGPVSALWLETRKKFSVTPHDMPRQGALENRIEIPAGKKTYTLDIDGELKLGDKVIPPSQDWKHRRVLGLLERVSTAKTLWHDVVPRVKSVWEKAGPKRAIARAIHASSTRTVPEARRDQITWALDTRPLPLLHALRATYLPFFLQGLLDVWDFAIQRFFKATPLDLHIHMDASTGVIKTLGLNERPLTEPEVNRLDKIFERVIRKKDPALYEMWLKIRDFHNRILRETGIDPLYMPQEDGVSGFRLRMPDGRQYKIQEGGEVDRAGDFGLDPDIPSEELAQIDLFLKKVFPFRPAFKDFWNQTYEIAEKIRNAGLPSHRYLPRSMMGELDVLLLDGKKLKVTETGSFMLDRRPVADHRPYEIELLELLTIHRSIFPDDESTRMFGKGNSTRMFEILENASAQRDRCQVSGFADPAMEPRLQKDTLTGKTEMHLMDLKGREIVVERTGYIRARFSGGPFEYAGNNREILRSVFQMMYLIISRKVYDPRIVFWNDARRSRARSRKNGFPHPNEVPRLIRDEEIRFDSGVSVSSKQRVTQGLRVPGKDGDDLIVNHLGQKPRIFIILPKLPSDTYVHVRWVSLSAGEMERLRKLRKRAVNVNPSLAPVWDSIETHWREKNRRRSNLSKFRGKAPKTAVSKQTVIRPAPQKYFQNRKVRSETRTLKNSRYLAFLDEAMVPENPDKVAPGERKPTQGAGSRSPEESLALERFEHPPQADAGSGVISQAAKSGNNPATREKAQVGGKGRLHWQDRAILLGAGLQGIDWISVWQGKEPLVLVDQNEMVIMTAEIKGHEALELAPDPKITEDKGHKVTRFELKKRVARSEARSFTSEVVWYAGILAALSLLFKQALYLDFLEFVASGVFFFGLAGAFFMVQELITKGIEGAYEYYLARKFLKAKWTREKGSEGVTEGEIATFEIEEFDEAKAFSESPDNLTFVEQGKEVPRWVLVPWDSLVVPLAEEIVFSGFLLPAMAGHLGSLVPFFGMGKPVLDLGAFVGLLLTALMFAEIHSEGVGIRFISHFLSWIPVGLAYLVTGNLFVPILSRMLYQFQNYALLERLQRAWETRHGIKLDESRTKLFRELEEFQKGNLSDWVETHQTHVALLMIQSLLKDPAMPWTNRWRFRKLRRAQARLVRKLNATPDQIWAAIVASRFHDIGKVWIDQSLINDPGKLTPSQRREMNWHVRLTEEILRAHEAPEEVIQIAGEHHENFDGTGFPKGLRASQTSPLGRLLRIIDSFSAMVGPGRPYQKPKSIIQAADELKVGKGSLYDPQLVDAFIEILAALFPLEAALLKAAPIQKLSIQIGKEGVNENNTFLVTYHRESGTHSFYNDRGEKFLELEGYEDCTFRDHEIAKAESNRAFAVRGGFLMVREEGKWFFYNREGKPVLGAQRNHLLPDERNVVFASYAISGEVVLFEYRSDKEKGVVVLNQEGRLVLTVPLSEDEEWGVEDGFFWFRKGKRYRFFNSEGNFLFEKIQGVDFDRIEGLQNEEAYPAPAFALEKAGRLTFYDQTGKAVLSARAGKDFDADAKWSRGGFLVLARGDRFRFYRLNKRGVFERRFVFEKRRGVDFTHWEAKGGFLELLHEKEFSSFYDASGRMLFQRGLEEFTGWNASRGIIHFQALDPDKKTYSYHWYDLHPPRPRAEPASPARGELRRAEDRGEASAELQQSRAEVRGNTKKIEAARQSAGVISGKPSRDLASLGHLPGAWNPGQVLLRLPRASPGHPPLWMEWMEKFLKPKSLRLRDRRALFAFMRSLFEEGPPFIAFEWGQGIKRKDFDLPKVGLPGLEARAQIITDLRQIWKERDLMKQHGDLDFWLAHAAYSKRMEPTSYLEIQKGIPHLPDPEGLIFHTVLARVTHLLRYTQHNPEIIAGQQRFLDSEILMELVPHLVAQIIGEDSKREMSRQESLRRIFNRWVLGLTRNGRIFYDGKAVQAGIFPDLGSAYQAQLRSRLKHLVHPKTGERIPVKTVIDLLQSIKDMDWRGQGFRPPWLVNRDLFMFLQDLLLEKTPLAEKKDTDPDSKGLSFGDPLLERLYHYLDQIPYLQIDPLYPSEETAKLDFERTLTADIYTLRAASGPTDRKARGEVREEPKRIMDKLQTQRSELRSTEAGPQRSEARGGPRTEKELRPEIYQTKDEIFKLRREFKERHSVYTHKLTIFDKLDLMFFLYPALLIGVFGESIIEFLKVLPPGLGGDITLAALGATVITTFIVTSKFLADLFIRGKLKRISDQRRDQVLEFVNLLLGDSSERKKVETLNQGLELLLKELDLEKTPAAQKLLEKARLFDQRLRKRFSFLRLSQIKDFGESLTTLEELLFTLSRVADVKIEVRDAIARLSESLRTKRSEARASDLLEGVKILTDRIERAKRRETRSEVRRPEDSSRRDFFKRGLLFFAGIELLPGFIRRVLAETAEKLDETPPEPAPKPGPPLSFYIPDLRFPKDASELPSIETSSLEDILTLIRLEAIGFYPTHFFVEDGKILWAEAGQSLKAAEKEFNDFIVKLTGKVLYGDTRGGVRYKGIVEEMRRNEKMRDLYPGGPEALVDYLASSASLRERFTFLHAKLFPEYFARHGWGYFPVKFPTWLGEGAGERKIDVLIPEAQKMVSLEWIENLEVQEGDTVSFWKVDVRRPDSITERTKTFGLADLIPKEGDVPLFTGFTIPGTSYVLYYLDHAEREQHRSLKVLKRMVEHPPAFEWNEAADLGQATEVSAYHLLRNWLGDLGIQSVSWAPSDLGVIEREIRKHHQKSWLIHEGTHVKRLSEPATQETFFRNQEYGEVEAFLNELLGGDAPKYSYLGMLLATRFLKNYPLYAKSVSYLRDKTAQLIYQEKQLSREAYPEIEISDLRQKREKFFDLDQKTQIELVGQLWRLTDDEMRNLWKKIQEKLHEDFAGKTSRSEARAERDRSKESLAWWGLRAGFSRRAQDYLKELPRFPPELKRQILSSIDSALKERLKRLSAAQTLALIDAYLEASPKFLDYGLGQYGLRKILSRFAEWDLTVKKTPLPERERVATEASQFRDYLVKLGERLEGITKERLVTWDDFEAGELEEILVQLPKLQEPVRFKLSDKYSLFLLNDLLKELGSKKRIYAGSAPQAFFIYDQAQEVKRQLISQVRTEGFPPRPVGRPIRFLVFERTEDPNQMLSLRSPHLEAILGHVGADDFGAAFLDTVEASYLERLLDFFDSKGSVDGIIEQFFRALGIQSLPPIGERLNEEVRQFLLDWINGQEVGHLSHFLETGEPAENLASFIEPFLRRESPTPLIASLEELLANLAPQGVYERVLRRARRGETEKARAMLYWHQLILMSYEDNWGMPTQHYRYEVPLIYALLKDGPEKIKEKLERLLVTERLFERMNRIFMEIYRELAKIPEGERGSYFRKKEEETKELVASVMKALGAADERIAFFRNFDPSETAGEEREMILRYVSGGRYRTARMKIPASYGSPGVFTTALIEATSELLKEGDHFLDLGAGAGEVGLVLGKRAGRLVLTDINGESLKIAEENLKENGVEKFELRSGDLFEPVAGETFDVIASNPNQAPVDPARIGDYGRDFQWNNLGGADGRETIERILREGPAHLKPGGRIVMMHTDVTDLNRTKELAEELDLEVRELKRIRVPVAEVKGDPHWESKDWIETSSPYRFEKDPNGRLYFNLYVLSIQPLLGGRQIAHRAEVRGGASVEEIANFLGIPVDLLDPKDLYLQTIVRAPKDFYVFRGERSFGSGTIHGLHGLEPEPMSSPLSYRQLPDPGIHSRAGISGNADRSRFRLKSTESLKRLLTLQGRSIGGVINMSAGGTIRQEGGDPFITTTRSPQEALTYADELLYIIKIPKGEFLIDIIREGEERVLIPHYIPSERVVGILISVLKANRPYLRKEVNLLQKVSRFPQLRFFFLDTLSILELQKVISTLGIHEPKFYVELHSNPKRLNAGLIQLHIPDAFYPPELKKIGLDHSLINLVSGQTLREALQNYPLYYYLFEEQKDHWGVFDESENPVLFDQQLGKSAALYVKPPFRAETRWTSPEKQGTVPLEGDRSELRTPPRAEMRGEKLEKTTEFFEGQTRGPNQSPEGSRLKDSVIGDRKDGLNSFLFEDDMRSPFSDDPSGLLEGFYGFRTRKISREVRHTDSGKRRRKLSGNAGQAPFFMALLLSLGPLVQHFQDVLNRFFNILAGIRKGFSLADTARKSRTFGDVTSSLVGVDNYLELHSNRKLTDDPAKSQLYLPRAEVRGGRQLEVGSSTLEGGSGRAERQSGSSFKPPTSNFELSSQAEVAVGALFRIMPKGVWIGLSGKEIGALLRKLGLRRRTIIPETGRHLSKPESLGARRLRIRRTRPKRGRNRLPRIASQLTIPNATDFLIMREGETAQVFASAA